MKIVPTLKAATVLFTLMLAGCGDGNNKYGCKMPGACAPVRMTYGNARENTSWNGWSVDGAYGGTHKKQKRVTLSAPGDGAAGDDAVGRLEPSGATGTVGSLEHPVYHPATPFMVWLAPYVTQHHHLHSSSLEWFTVSGYWEGPDGTHIPITHSRKPSGSGSAWHPLRPNEMGFQSVGRALKAHASSGILGSVVQPR